jgi:leader peptidase (prepilin peptidase) / N-methyltransferase
MHGYINDLSLVPSWFTAVVGGMFGAIFASFFGVVGERVPRHETLWGRSHCVCGVDLGAANIPIAGWLLTRGRARCCGAKIPIRYVIVEIFLTVSWALAGYGHSYWPLRLIFAIVTAALALRMSWVRPLPLEKGSGIGPNV